MAKLFVGNLDVNSDMTKLRKLFETFGPVAECDQIKNFAFVHMKSKDDAMEAVAHLNQSRFNNKTIKVEESTTDVHKTPGLGSQGECFRCGSKKHWSRNCPQEGPRKGGRGRGQGRGGGPRGGGPRRGGGYQGFSGGTYGEGFGHNPYGYDGWGQSMQGYDQMFPGGSQPKEEDNFIDAFDIARREKLLEKRERELERRYQEAYRKLAMARETGIFRDRSPVRGPSSAYSKALAERSMADPLSSRGVEPLMRKSLLDSTRKPESLLSRNLSDPLSSRSFDPLLTRSLAESLTPSRAADPLLSQYFESSKSSGLNGSDMSSFGMGANGMSASGRGMGAGGMGAGGMGAGRMAAGGMTAGGMGSGGMGRGRMAAGGMGSGGMGAGGMGAGASGGVPSLLNPRSLMNTQRAPEPLFGGRALGPSRTGPPRF